MESLFGFFAVTASDTIIEKHQNQITFENFIERAKEKSVLQYKSGSMKGWFGKEKKEIPYGALNSSYNVLYDLLIDVGIIETQVDSASFLTWSKKYTVTSQKKLLDSKKIEELLNNKNNKDYQFLKQHYIINFDKLSELLNNYIYNSTDQFKILNPVGGYKKYKYLKKNKKYKRTRTKKIKLYK